MAAATTRVFMNGNSQAVRIPQEFRLGASTAEISRNEHGAPVLHPVALDRGSALLQALSGFDDSFIAELEAQRLELPPVQERAAL